MVTYSTDSEEHKINTGEISGQETAPDWYFEDPIFFEEDYKAMSEFLDNDNED